MAKNRLKKTITNQFFNSTRSINTNQFTLMIHFIKLVQALLKVGLIIFYKFLKIQIFKEFFNKSASAQCN